MLARVQSYLLQGIEAHPCEVEVDFTELESTMSDPKWFLVGLPDTAVKESIERVKSAISNSGYTPPWGRTLVNLAPADVRKEGPTYDLPIAIGFLVVQGVIRPVRGPEDRGLDYRKLVFGGELALDGRLRPIKGAIAMAALAKQRGASGVVVSADNAQEAAVVEGVNVYGVRTLSEVVGLLTGQIEPEPVHPPDVGSLLRNAAAPIDFAEVRGQEGVKRAIVVAAAGGHNLFPLGPSGGNGGVRMRTIRGLSQRRNPVLPCLHAPTVRA